MGETLLGGGAGEYEAMPAHHGGVTVAEVLASAGVTTLFCLPGGHIAPVTHGCATVGIDVVTTRHESAAIHMAEAWARRTGRTGVAAVTAGPGFTNGVTGLANAQATGIPVVVLGGRTPLGLRGRGAVQDADQQAVAKAVAKWSTEVTTPEGIGRSVMEAIVVAGSPRTGSAFIDLPTDVLLSEAPPWKGAVPVRQATPADAAAVEEAVHVLAAAERPVCIVGGGGHWSGAADALERFARYTGIPVATTSHARGLLPDSDPACLGSLLHGGVATAFADTVLVVGSRFNGNLVFGGPPLWNDQQTIVQIDADPAAFGLNRSAEVALTGDAAVVLDQLTEAWSGDDPTEWSAQAHALAAGSRAHWDAECEGPAVGVHPGALAREVCSFARELGPDTTTVLDGGDILGWGLAFSSAETPGTLMFTSDALGTLGVGVPYTVGASLARPDARVVGLIGDGAFGFSAMEIETAVRSGAAPIVVVSNNASWGDVRYEESQWFGQTTGTDITPARYGDLCRSLGGHGERVERIEDVRPTLERAAASGVVSVVDVRTDPDRPNEVLRNMGALNLQ